MPFSAAKRYRAPRLRREHSPHIVRPSGTTRLTTLRSEEHTSELQSRSDLVCRLLLEKKKKYRRHTSRYSTESKQRSGLCWLLMTTGQARTTRSCSSAQSYSIKPRRTAALRTTVVDAV